MTLTIFDPQRRASTIDYDPRHDALSQQARLPNIQERWLGWAFASGLKTLSNSWRHRYRGLEILDQFDRSAQRYILASWHRDYISLFGMYRQRSVLAVTNQSHRGQVIAEICHRSGMRTVQVRRTGTKQMLASLQQISSDQHGIAITVDGPLGPALEVKRVVAHLAGRLRCPIVPISVAAKGKYVCHGRWDQLTVPYPFSKIGIVIGAPIEVTAERGPEERRQIAERVKVAIETGEHLAQDMIA